jgi:hypothetical protein
VAIGRAQTVHRIEVWLDEYRDFQRAAEAHGRVATKAMQKGILTKLDILGYREPIRNHADLLKAFKETAKTAGHFRKFLAEQARKEESVAEAEAAKLVRTYSWALGDEDLDGEEDLGYSRRSVRDPALRLASRGAQFATRGKGRRAGPLKLSWVPVFARDDIQGRYAQDAALTKDVARAMLALGDKLEKSFRHTFSTWDHQPTIKAGLTKSFKTAPGTVEYVLYVYGPTVPAETERGGVQDLYALISRGARPHVIAPVQEFPAHPFRGWREYGPQGPEEKRLFIRQRKAGGWAPKSSPAVARAYRGAMANPAEIITLERDEAVGHPGVTPRRFEEKIWARYSARMAGAIERAVGYRVGRMK